MTISTRATGFAPIAGKNARILILGTLPSRRSLEIGEYYGHPRNAFWPIMRELFDVRGSYAARCEALAGYRIAVWDVLRSSVRPGSLDAHIRLDSAKANDFDCFLRCHPDLELICFNGRTAEKLFRKFVGVIPAGGDLDFEVLPSTSPAHASLRFEEKLARWRGALKPENNANEPGGWS